MHNGENTQFNNAYIFSYPYRSRRYFWIIQFSAGMLCFLFTGNKLQMLRYANLVQHIKRYNGFLYATMQLDSSRGRIFRCFCVGFRKHQKMCGDCVVYTKEFALICACSRWFPLNITMGSQTCYIWTVFVVSDQHSLNLSLAD